MSPQTNGTRGKSVVVRTRPLIEPCFCEILRDRRLCASCVGFITDGSNPDALVFHSKRSGPLLETTILNQGLYPALEAWVQRRQGCTPFVGAGTACGNSLVSIPLFIANTWDTRLAAMTALYTGEIPLEHVQAE